MKKATKQSRKTKLRKEKQRIEQSKKKIHFTIAKNRFSRGIAKGMVTHLLDSSHIDVIERQVSRSSI